MSDILQEFEELIRIREHFDRSDRISHDGAFNDIKKALGDEYIANIEEKIERWISVTKVEYFLNKPPVVPYFEAKMLFRDGYFESVVSMCRIICEMICVEILQRIPHPFGTAQEIEQESFRVLLKYAALPKHLSVEAFDMIAGNLDPASDEKKLFKSSYEKNNTVYVFKSENGRTARNLNRLMQCFQTGGFEQYEHFSLQSYEFLNQVYDLASDYLHGRQKGEPEDQAFQALDKTGFVLFELYGVKSIDELIGKTIETAYAKFPKIHTGTNFWISFFPTPQAAIAATKPSDKKDNNPKKD